MKQAQILGFGLEERLTQVLGELAQGRDLWLREIRHAKTCLNLLRQGGASILVLRLGKNLDVELSLLAEVSELFPAARTIVLGAVENQALAALTWDLGADYVLFPPQPMEHVGDVVLSFLPQNRSTEG